MFAEITSAVSSAKIALDIAKAAHGLSNYNELVAAVYDVSAKLAAASVVTLASLEKQSALTKRVSELENQLLQLENWEGTLQKYKLHKFTTGSLAYISETSMQNGEPQHYLCTSCVSNRQKSILQPKGVNLHCSSCGADIKIRDQSYMAPLTGL